MSDYRIKLTKRAQRDFFSIQRYTLCTYGKAQTQAYAQLITQRINNLADNPKLGHRRKDMPDTFKAFRAGQHMIIYRVEADILYVVALLHGHMDFDDQLDDENRPCPFSS